MAKKKSKAQKLQEKNIRTRHRVSKASKKANNGVAVKPLKGRKGKLGRPGAEPVPGQPGSSRITL